MSEQLKDIFFTKKSISDLSFYISKVYPDFEKNKFEQYVFSKGWEEKELKAKMRHVTESLFKTLPSNFKKSISILKKVVPNISGFDGMVFPDYVEMYGLNDLDTSLKALVYFTKFFSSEFAIRPFIIKYPERVMPFMEKCAEDKNDHVRRFSSEGCRPRLPWAMALPEFKKDPSPIIPILEKLRNDPSEFVRRSVANNLNDISKDNPDIALSIFKNWYGDSENTNQIVKHACRTLLKSGNQEAMKLFGYGRTDSVEINHISLSKQTVKIGETIEFAFELTIKGNTANNTRLEYEMEFAKANNKTTKKVFKISEKYFEPGSYKYTKKHSFEKISTRKYYPGKHKITLIINGKKTKEISFNLI